MRILKTVGLCASIILMGLFICVGYWAWTEELGSYVEKVPDDAMSNDWLVPFRQDFASYNVYYMYDFWRTAPYGETIEQCLNGKIPYLK